MNKVKTKGDRQDIFQQLLELMKQYRHVNQNV